MAYRSAGTVGVGDGFLPFRRVPELGDEEAARVVVVVPQPQTVRELGFHRCFLPFMADAEGKAVAGSQVFGLEERQVLCLGERYRLPLFVEHGPSGQTRVELKSIEGHRYEFEVGASAQDLSDHRFVLHRVDAARGVDEVAARHQQRSAAHRDVHLHLEHLPAFLGRPIPPHVPILSCGGRPRAGHIGNDGIKARRGQPSEVSTVMLRDHDVGQPQTAAIAHQHVEATRDGFVGHDHTLRVQAFAELGGFRAGRGAHVEGKCIAVGREQSYGKHAGGFLTRDSAGFMQQGHHSLRPTFRCSPSSKGHDEGRFLSHPRKLNRPERFYLLNGPRSVASMKGNSERFRERFKRGVQPA